MKKLCLVLVLLMMTLIVQAQDGYICGDVDEDLEVNITDAYLIALFYTNPSLSVNSLPKVADVNADDKIDIIDALLIAQYYVGLIDHLNCIEPEPISIDLTGKWRPSTKVSLSLKEDEYVYDPGSNQWTSEIKVFLKGPITNTFTAKAKINDNYSSGHYALEMHSATGEYPYYDLVIVYNVFPYETLQEGRFRIMESETEYTDYEVSPNSIGERVSISSTHFSIYEVEFKNPESSEALSLHVNGELDKTEVLYANTPYTFYYEKYDSILELKFVDSVNCAIEVIEGDVIYYIEGTWDKFGSTVVMNIPPRTSPRLELPVVLQIVTEDDQTVYLQRIVKNEPSLKSIANYYGITASNIENYTYAIGFLYSKYQ